MLALKCRSECSVNPSAFSLWHRRVKACPSELGFIGSTPVGSKVRTYPSSDRPRPRRACPLRDALAVLAQNGHGERVESDRSRLMGLRWSDHPPSVYVVLDGSTNVELPGLEVEVAPAQPGQLATAQPRGRRDRDGGGEDRLTAALGAADISSCTICGVGIGAEGRAPDRGLALSVTAADTTPHLTAWRSAAERTRWRWWTGWVESLGQPLPVAAVEVLCAQPLERHVAEFVGDPLDLEPVASHRAVARFGLVAQWSERGTHNPLVAGSIPAGPTRLPFAQPSRPRPLVRRPRRVPGCGSEAVAVRLAD